jgi:hypothetical protein
MSWDISRQTGDGHRATTSLEVDFALVLASTIDEIRADPAQLRSAIYELARIKLEEEAFLKKPSVDIQQIDRVRSALETAIHGVETFALKKESRTLLPLPAKNQASYVIDSRESFLGLDDAPVVTAKSKESWSVFARNDRLKSQLGRLLVFAAIGAALLYPIVGRHSGSAASPKSADETGSTIQVASVASQAVDNDSPPGISPESAARNSFFVDVERGRLPLPNAYGIYAISNGELHELNVLPGRAPDPRILVSAAIRNPSQTTLADGRVVFVAYRRDLATSAPDRISVRVVAKVMRGMSFNSKGGTDTVSVEDIWAIRNISHHFRVAPVPEHPEMLVFRPEAAGFVFPAGRYALVLNGQAYDFAIAGSITEASQCLERIEAANGTFYSECNRDQTRRAR